MSAPIGSSSAARHLNYLLKSDPVAYTRYLYEPTFHAKVYEAYGLLDRAEDFLGCGDALTLANRLYDKLVAS